ncbi:MAG TPA: AMP-binding protein, partial [Usitatibacter sp.]|nr:AMP-binding protein [Usitatibacter sp.]
MIASLPPPPGERFNFAQHLLERNRTRAGKAAYIDDQGILSYGELDERVRRMASALVAKGLRREERVLLLMHDNNDWPVAFLGALYAGIVPVAVNTLLSGDDYAYILSHCRAQAALVSPALLPVLEKAMAQAPHEVKFTWASPLNAEIAGHEPMAASAPTRCDDIAFWLYTSGSTGKPKG